MREVEASATMAFPIIAEAWDKNKTMRQNFTSLGLVEDVNIPATRPKKPADPNAKPIEGIVGKLEAAAKQEQANATVRFAAAGEVRFIEQLVEKHGDDFVAMAKDHKLNVYQHTPAQLKRKYKKVAASLSLAGQTSEQEAEGEASE